MRRKTTKKKDTAANLGFEEKLWLAADKLRGNLDAAEYKHIALGLIFLKYISDAFQERHKHLKSEAERKGSDWYVKDAKHLKDVLEDRDAYTMKSVFFVPPEARWEYLQSRAKDPKIGKLIDSAMDALERDNASLKGVLPKVFAREAIDKRRLGELIDLIGTIGLGDKESRTKDVLGRVYEYFLAQFASAEGKKGGQFYTPRCIVRLLVEMLQPYKGKVLDPCCGSGGMFVQSEGFVRAHGGNLSDLTIFGQESNQTTWRLCKMNLAIRHIESKMIAWNTEGSFHNDAHKDLKASFVMANPPFNDSDWGGERLTEDKRWKYGVPPKGNANFAWVQHFIHHLSPTGTAGFVLANGALSAAGAQQRIRAGLIDDDLVDCIVALPLKLFYNFQGPASLWFLTRDKTGRRGRRRRREALFIDARRLCVKVDPKRNEMTDSHVAKVASTYHVWRSRHGYSDQIGYCRSATIEEIASCDYSLVPARYVGITVEQPNPSSTVLALNQSVEGIGVALRRLEDLSHTVQRALSRANEQT